MRVVTLGPPTVYSTQGQSCDFCLVSVEADPDEVAVEEYVMRRMPPGEKVMFRRHLMKCHACAKRVAETRVFVEAIRDAGSFFRGLDQQNEYFSRAPWWQRVGVMVPAGRPVRAVPMRCACSRGRPSVCPRYHTGHIVTIRHLSAHHGYSWQLNYEISPKLRAVLCRYRS